MFNNGGKKKKIKCTDAQQSVYAMRVLVGMQA